MNDRLLHDIAEFDRLYALRPGQTEVASTFHLCIFADRKVSRDEVVAVMKYRFPWFGVDELVDGQPVPPPLPEPEVRSMYLNRGLGPDKAEYR